MNLEELSKSQLLLLTVLVNFVVSIGTGVITVSLLDQAPPFVTQTVNRVVEHTIETVTKAVPAAVVTAQSPVTQATPVTPAPSNQDLVTYSLGAAGARIVGIYNNVTGTSTAPAAVGDYLPGARAVVTTTSAAALPREALIAFQNGSLIPASLSRSGNGLAIYGFSDSAVLPKLEAPSLVMSSSLKLGETALAVSADGSASTGIVSRVGSMIRTTLPNIGPGMSAVDLSGNIIGISDGSAAGVLIPAERITALLTASSSPAS